LKSYGFGTDVRFAILIFHISFFCAVRSFRMARAQRVPDPGKKQGVEKGAVSPGS